MKINIYSLFVIINILSLNFQIFAADIRGKKRNQECADLADHKKSKKPKNINYKIAVLYDEYGPFMAVVPKERFIKEVLNNVFYTRYISATKIIKPYKNNDDIRNQVQQLPEFDEEGMMMPAMKNGHIKRNDYSFDNHDWDRMDYGYIIGDAQREIQGAMHLSLMISEATAHLNGLGVAQHSQNQGNGSSLLQLALCLTSLYGHDGMELQSTPEALRTYAKHGFWFFSWGDESDNNDDYALWQDHSSLSQEALLKLGQEHDFMMKFDFNIKSHTEMLDKYMQRHAKVTEPFSLFLKGHIMAIKAHQKQLDKLIALCSKKDNNSQKAAKELYLTLSSELQFPQSLVSALRFL
jgi:hypothetical protein